MLKQDVEGLPLTPLYKNSAVVRGVKSSRLAGEVGSPTLPELAVGFTREGGGCTQFYSESYSPRSDGRDVLLR